MLDDGLLFALLGSELVVDSKPTDAKWQGFAIPNSLLFSRIAKEAGVQNSLFLTLSCSPRLLCR